MSPNCEGYSRCRECTQDAHDHIREAAGPAPAAPPVRGFEVHPYYLQNLDPTAHERSEALRNWLSDRAAAAILAQLDAHVRAYREDYSAYRQIDP